MIESPAVAPVFDVYAAANAWVMSFFAWLALAFFHSQLVVSMSSFVDPPVNVSSVAESTGSTMNFVESADDVWSLTLSQSSPGAAVLAAFPSSSNRPSSCTATTGDARAKLKYCSSSDSTNKADHDRATPRLTRGLSSPSAPHEVTRPSLPDPIRRWMTPVLRPCAPPGAPYAGRSWARRRRRSCRGGEQ